MSVERPLEAALADLAAALASTGVRHMLIGGVAVVARGVTRFTRDLDAAVWGPDIELAALVETLSQHGFVSRVVDLEEFVRRTQVLVLRHRASDTDVDLSLAWLPFESEALDLATRERLGGQEVPVARAEDLVIYKAVAARPRDLEDLEGLLLLHGPCLDLARVRRIVGEFAAALDDPRRLEALERAIHRTAR
jgi:predicted nucleotidyltransferase